MDTEGTRVGILGSPSAYGLERLKSVLAAKGIQWRETLDELSPDLRWRIVCSDSPRSRRGIPVQLDQTHSIAASAHMQPGRTLVLDEVLLDVTQGQVHTIDLMQSIYGEWLRLQSAPNALIGSEQIASLAVDLDLAGHDFSLPFERYVSGTEPLPLWADPSGRVRVDLGALPPSGPLYGGGDGLILSRGLEAGSDPEHLDTDNDGLSDFDGLGRSEVDGTAEDWSEWDPVVTDPSRCLCPDSGTVVSHLAGAPISAETGSIRPAKVRRDYWETAQCAPADWVFTTQSVESCSGLVSLS